MHIYPLSPGSAHGTQSYLIILVALSLSALDIFAAARRIIAFLQSPDRSPGAFWRYVIKKEQLPGTSPEYSGIIADEPEEYDSSKLPRDSLELQRVSLTGSDDHSDDHPNSHPTEQWAHAVHRHQRHYSTASEGTVFGSHSYSHSQDTLDELKSGHGLLPPRSFLTRIGRAAFAVVERALVIAGFVQLLAGIVTYTGESFCSSELPHSDDCNAGGCRQNYVNGCLAHLISMCMACLYLTVYSISPSVYRRWHFLVLWSPNVCSIFGIVRRYRLVMEYFAVR